MSDLDVSVVDEYARHLSKVNERNQVLATEDIYNDQGVLLIKKGTPVSDKLADKVIKHKLIRPLEHSVNLSNVIDNGRLMKSFKQLFERFPDCGAIHEALKLEFLLDEQCREYAHYPLLMQKFTVMAMQRPHDYQKGLFCAWFGLAMAKLMKLELVQQTEVFLAGLVHDTGMLHISGEILDKKGQLTTEEWRAIQSHPKIGELFLRHVPDLPDGVARATLEHHERLDGTGYPQAKFGDSLSLVGQVVAIADSICAIRMLRLQREGSTMASIIPILQLNGRIYDEQVYRAAVSVIREGHLTILRTHDDEQMPELIGEILKAHELLNRCFEGIAEVMQLLPEDLPAKPLRTASLQVHNSWFAVASSGLLSLTLRRMVEHATDCDDQGLFDVIEELHLMLRELSWQFSQLRKVLKGLHDDHLFDGAAAELLDESLEKLSALDQVVIH